MKKEGGNMLKNGKTNNLFLNFYISAISILLSLVVSAIIIACLGASPLDTYSGLIRGAFGTRQAVTVSITSSVPYIFTGLSVALAFQCKVFSIGAEGQLLIGAMAAALMGAYVNLPAMLHLPLVLLSSMAAGMFFAYLSAILWEKRNVNVVISTILLNYVAQYLTQYLILGPFNAKDGTEATKIIYASAMLPKLLERPYVLNLGIVIALLAIVGVYIFFNKTARGYELKAVGMNKNAAFVNGINVKQNMFLALVISGALAGLAGGIEVTGTLSRNVYGFSANYGFSGIPVALMARNNPFAIFFTALLLGSMRNGSLMMQSTMGISKDFVDIIEGLIIIFLCAENLIRYYLKKSMKNAIKGGNEIA
jgi:ABC-type uncharacterized transport system permease subunit